MSAFDGMLRQGHMHLGAFFHPTGNHVASWLHPEAQLDAGTNFRHYAQLAQTAERGKFDLMFLADAVAVRGGDLQALRRWPQYMAFFDPLTLLAGIAAVTRHLGLVATATTSYNEPYTLARRLAALDHMSDGRAGWNIVTSSNEDEAFNYGRDAHFEHAERYARAAEFVDVVRGLLDSWDDDAFTRDRSTAEYFDPAKLHVLDHKGPHFSVRGPLNMPRPPQGYPVFAQASASGTGLDMAAKTAEIVFSPLHSLEAAQAFSRDLKTRAASYGRTADSIKIMPGLNPILGRTEAEAREKQAYLASLIHEDVGRSILTTALGGVDLSACDPDRALPDEVLAAGLRNGRSEGRIVCAMAREGLTFRQVYQRFGSARGQNSVVGTPEQVADHMQAWFRAGAVDGFLIQPSVLPTDLDEFVDTIIPILQERRLFRTEYDGFTLRQNLALERPSSRYAHLRPNDG
ncbi:MAG: LLM class flavin-dependent oxidoreductase [Janthinobacterium lividum]